MPYLDGLHAVPRPTKYPLKEENATNAGVWRFSTVVVAVVTFPFFYSLVLYCTVLYRRVPAISKYSYKRRQIVTGHKVVHIGNMVNLGEETKFPV